MILTSSHVEVASQTALQYPPAHPIPENGLLWKISLLVVGILLIPAIIFREKLFTYFTVDQDEIPDVVLGKAPGLFAPKQAEFKICDQQEIFGLQSRIQQTNRKYKKLDLSFVAPSRLPVHKMQFGEVTYYCSKPYLMNGRKVVLACVKIEDKVYPRVFYFSQSQATWRVLPSVEKKGPKKILGYFNKGLFESDTQLPFALNLGLIGLMNLSNSVTPSFPNPMANILETLVDRLPPQNYRSSLVKSPFAWSPESAPKYFVRDSKRIPLLPNPHDTKMPHDKGLHPNFDNVLHLQEFESSQYGLLTAKLYPSMDGSLQFLFYEATDGRAFLAGIEKVKDNPINSYGIRKHAVDCGMFTAPLLEYANQISPGYEAFKGDRYKAKDDYSDSKWNYQSNWNYVSELEIIKLYYAQQKRDIPPKFIEKTPDHIGFEASRSLFNQAAKVQNLSEQYKRALKIDLGQ